MFASASHEFRTPLNAIINSFKFIHASFNNLREELCQHSYTFQKGLKCNSKVEIILNKISKFITMGSNSSVLLLSLIEDILNLSKIEGGVFTITKHDFKIDELLEEVYNIFYFQ